MVKARFAKENDMKFILAAVGMIGVGFLAGASSANAACETVTITEMN